MRLVKKTSRVLHCLGCRIRGRQDPAWRNKYDNIPSARLPHDTGTMASGRSIWGGLVGQSNILKYELSRICQLFRSGQLARSNNQESCRSWKLPSVQRCWKDQWCLCASPTLHLTYIVDTDMTAVIFMTPVIFWNLQVLQEEWMQCNSSAYMWKIRFFRTKLKKRKAPPESYLSCRLLC